MNGAIPPEIDRSLATSSARDRLGNLASVLVYREVVVSTNDLALELCSRDAADGTTVVASRQTAGRGRQGRTWFSPVGGLYMSVVLHQTTSPVITLLAGVAAAEGVHAATGVAVELEWPNDLVKPSVPGATAPSRRPKLGGILCEAATNNAVVVGIGVNLSRAEYPAEIADRASFVAPPHGEPVDRGRVLVEILASLAQWRQHLHSDGPDAMLARWRSLSPSCEGARVAWDAPDGRRSGVTAGVDPNGALQVRRGDHVESIVAGPLDWYPEASPGVVG